MIRLNNRVTIRAWGATQNDIGSPVASETGAWDMWAEIEDRSGSSQTPYQQKLWTYDYKITMRWEKGRVIGSNNTIDYDGKRLIINSIAPINEAERRYAVARCTAIDQNVATGGGGAVTPLPQIGFYNYTGVGGETTFTAIAGKQVFWAGKGGVYYAIITTGSPVGRQVLWNKVAGTFEWGLPIFEPGEDATLLYIL